LEFKNMLEHTSKYRMVVEQKMEPFPYKEVRTECPNADAFDLADDLLNFLAWELVAPAKWFWVFRGVRNHKYRLESSLDRRLGERKRFGTVHSCTAVGRQGAEDYLLSQFKKAAQHYPEAAIVNDGGRLEWLAMMQHYGCPTRLLDFTRSPYVACFFALEEIVKNDQEKVEEGAVWAVDTDWLMRRSCRRIRENNILRDCNEDSLLNSEFVANNFEELFVQNQQPLVLPVTPFRLNRRLVPQQGLFLCPSLARLSFEENLASYGDDSAEHVLKIVVQAGLRTELLSELRLMNVSLATLFPDLQGYAKSLAHELEYRSPDEIERLR
jgi:hypothetical protein